MRAVEKGTVSESLRVSKTEAQEDQGEIERGCTFPIFDVPPLGQFWTTRQCRSLQGEKHNEKTEVTPEQTRTLGLNGRTGEHVGWEVFASSASGTGECEEHHEDRVDNRRCRLDPIGPFHQEKK
ncbi:MAG: hypothetical protein WB558_25890 [Terriglobales bacterium]